MSDTCTFGSPGATVSATFSPLDRGDCVDVGAIIWSETHPYVVHNGSAVLFNGQQVHYYRGVRNGQ